MGHFSHSEEASGSFEEVEGSQHFIIDMAIDDKQLGLDCIAEVAGGNPALDNNASLSVEVAAAVNKCYFAAHDNWERAFNMNLNFL